MSHALGYCAAAAESCCNVCRWTFARHSIRMPAASKIGEAPHDDICKVVRERLAQDGLFILLRKQDGLIESVVANRRDFLYRQNLLVAEADGEAHRVGDLVLRGLIGDRY